MNPPEAKQRGWSIVFAAPDEWRAQIVKDSLIDEGIPALIQSNCVAAYGTALNPCGGSWGDVLVPNTCRNAALRVLAELLDENGTR